MISKNITHTLDRLNMRGLPYTMNQLIGLAQETDGRTAIVLGKVRSFENPRIQDYAVLIVRNNEPVTIFTRRTSQTMDKRNFDVDRIIYQ